MGCPAFLLPVISDPYVLGYSLAIKRRGRGCGPPRRRQETRKQSSRREGRHENFPEVWPLSWGLKEAEAVQGKGGSCFQVRRKTRARTPRSKTSCRARDSVLLWEGPCVLQGDGTPAAGESGGQGGSARHRSLEGQLKAAAPEPAIRTLDSRAILPLMLTVRHRAGSSLSPQSLSRGDLWTQAGHISTVPGT